MCLVKFKNTHCTRTPYDKKNRKNFGKSGGTCLHEWSTWIKIGTFLGFFFFNKLSRICNVSLDFLKFSLISHLFVHHHHHPAEKRERKKGKEKHNKAQNIVFKVNCTKANNVVTKVLIFKLKTRKMKNCHLFIWLIITQVTIWSCQFAY